MEITKWEYESVGSVSEANELGKKGWEAYGTSKLGSILMKRPCGRLRVVEKVNGVEINSTDTDRDNGVER